MLEMPFEVADIRSAPGLEEYVSWREGEPDAPEKPRIPQPFRLDLEGYFIVIVAL